MLSHVIDDRGEVPPKRVSNKGHGFSGVMIHSSITGTRPIIIDVGYLPLVFLGRRTLGGLNILTDYPAVTGPT